jgi:hypothetical protein
MLDTATLSVAVPLMVKGLADAKLSTAPLAGTVITDAGGVTSAVVYENEKFAAIALPLASFTPVPTVTV